MGWLERANPETPCQPDGAHHPHLMVCGDDPDDCGCWDDYDDGRGYGPFRALLCCIDGEDWPCTTKRKHQAERHRVRR